MKKIGKYILCILLISIATPVMAKNYTDTFNDQTMWINDYIVKEQNGRRKYQQMTLMTRNSDQQFVYCIEPGTPIDSSKIMNGTDVNQAYVSNITEEQWKRVSLLAYYGYKYKDHTNIKWYSITQYLIWKTIPHGYDIYFTDTLNGKRIEKYTKEIEELEKLIQEHNKVPEFENNNITMKLGQTITLTDQNQVLSLYQVKENQALTITQNANQLQITANQSGNTTITLSKKDKNYSHPAIVYVDPESQDILVRGSYDPMKISISIKTEGAKITISKKDQDTKSSQSLSKEASLEGAIYGVYNNNNEKITTITTAKDGKATSTELPKLGTYYLLEEKAPTGYELDTNKHPFQITAENLHPVIEVFDNIIKAHVKITKVFGNEQTGPLIPEENIEFGIYDTDGTLFTKETTDKLGKLDILLPYGNWEIRQLTTTPGYDKIKPIQFEIKISKTQEWILSNGEITARLKVIKIDSKTKKNIPIAGIQFKIKDLKTKEYVCQNITYPTNKTICEYETDENGRFITPLPLKSGKYQLEEVDQKIDGYLWNQNTIKFEITNTSKIIDQKEFGPIMEIKFENQPVKGEAEIYKTGEKIVFENEMFFYQEKPLNNVTFDLYAGEDILKGDGTPVYHKDQYIKSFKTKDGYYKLENLYLGKYYLIEKESVENHIINTEKQYFTLEYQNQYTKTVSTKITLQNKLPKSKLILTKKDQTTNNPIEGTIFDLYTENNQLIYTGKTDKAGRIIIDNLFTGNFYIIERQATEGYQLSKEKTYFTISQNEEIIPLELTNEPIVDIPITNTEISLTSLFINITRLIIGIGLMIYAKID